MSRSRRAVASPPAAVPRRAGVGRGAPGRGVRREPGASVAELLVVVTILALAVGVATPNLVEMLRRARLQAAGRDMATRLRALRSEAVLDGRALGLVFERSQGFGFRVYRDGNGNGIRLRDIRARIDELVRPLHHVGDDYSGVAVAIRAQPPIPQIPPRRGVLRNLHDPVKVGGSSDIVSCRSSGSCSSGTVYLSLGSARMVAVRFKGWNAQVEVWEYEPRGRVWKLRGF